MDYIAYLHKDPKSDFGVSFPDFPGCVTAGKTLEEARRKAAQALALHIEGMTEDGEAIPEPSTVDDIAHDPALKGAVAFLVPANLEKTIRVNITARESQIEKIDILARRAGMTRSAYIVQSSIREERHVMATRGRSVSRSGRADTKALSLRGATASH
jgi:predicted RNase H-like HicB family nuclease